MPMKEDVKRIIAPVALYSASCCLGIVLFISLIFIVGLATNAILVRFNFPKYDRYILNLIVMMLVCLAVIFDPYTIAARKRQKKLTPVSDEEYSIMASRQYGIPQDYAIAVKRYLESELDIPLPWLTPEITLSQLDYYCPPDIFSLSDSLMVNEIRESRGLKDMNSNMTVGKYTRVMYDLGVCFDEFRK